MSGTDLWRWLLETLLGTGLLLWVFQKLPALLDRLEVKPLTSTRLPANDTPEVMQGALIGVIVFILWLIGAAIYNWPISVPVVLFALGLFPTLGGVIQQQFGASRALAEGHPWRVLVESLAQQAGLGPVRVRLVTSSLLHCTACENTIEITTRTVRVFAEAELRFLVGLALWELKTGKWQPDVGDAFNEDADRFALSLSGDLSAARSALLNLHQQQDLANYAPLEHTEQRIERLESWWQQRQNPPARQQTPQVQQLGRS
jgi:Zn-dependent protease with chaperone function